MVIRATNTSTLSSFSKTEISADAFSILPNLANDFIKIVNAKSVKIENVIVMDMNGRVIKSQKNNKLSDIELNLDLVSKRTYLVKIMTENAVFTKKILKN